MTQQIQIAPIFETVRAAIGDHLFVHRGKCMCGERLGADRGPVDPARMADHMAMAVTEALSPKATVGPFEVMFDPTMPVDELRLVNRQPMSEAEIPAPIKAAMETPLTNQRWGLKALRFAHEIIQFATPADLSKALADQPWNRDWVAMRRVGDSSVEGGHSPWFEICGAYRGHPRMLNSTAQWGVGCTRVHGHVGMHSAGL